MAASQTLPAELVLKIYHHYIKSFTPVSVDHQSNEFSELLKPCFINKAIWDEVHKHLFRTLTFAEQMNFRTLFTGERIIPNIFSTYLRKNIQHLQVSMTDSPAYMVKWMRECFTGYLETIKSTMPQLKSIHIVFTHAIPEPPPDNPDIDWYGDLSNTYMDPDIVYGVIVYRLRTIFGADVAKAITDDNLDNHLLEPECNASAWRTADILDALHMLSTKGTKFII